MKYNIRGQRMEVTDALRDYVEKKLSRLERYFEAPPQSDVNVTLSVTKGHQVVEVTIPLPGFLLRAEEKRDDMYASIDFVVDKLERQIRKHKTRINRNFRHPDSARALFKDDFGGGQGVSTLARDEEDDLELVRTKKFNFKPMLSNGRAATQRQEGGKPARVTAHSTRDGMAGLATTQVP